MGISTAIVPYEAAIVPYNRHSAQLRLLSRLAAGNKAARLQAKENPGVPILPGPNGIMHPEPYLDRVSRIISTLEKKHPDASALIYKAFGYAWEKHYGQARASGEPYIEHLVSVAEIAAAKGMSPENIAAALLHDIREDQKVALKDLEKSFGKAVAFKIEGLTELGKEPEFIGDKPNIVEVYKKFFRFGSKDMDILFLKLFDRLHNMRTLAWMPQEKQIKKARETQSIYAPLADRMGLSEDSRELADLSFKYLNSDEYERLSKAKDKLLEQSSEQQRAGIIAALRGKLNQLEIRVDINIRQRSIYEIFERIKDKKDAGSRDLTAGDVFQLEIVAPNRDLCCVVQGRIHQQLYRPVGGISDLFAVPPANDQRHLLSTVQVYIPDPVEPCDLFEAEALEKPFRLFGQLEMLIFDEYSFAYYRRGMLTRPPAKRNVDWLHDLLEELVKEGEISEADFVEAFGTVAAPIVVFTRRGDRIEIPRRATLLDFAAKIHQEVFKHAAAGVVNGQVADLSYRLRGGETIVIETEPAARPEIGWANLVRTPVAKRYLKNYLGDKKSRTDRDRFRDAMAALDEECQRYNLTAARLIETMLFKRYLRGIHMSSDEVLLEIGGGQRKARDVIIELRDRYLRMERKKQKWSFAPFYIVIKVRDRIGLSNSLTEPISKAQFNLRDIFPRYLPQEEGIVTMVLAVDVLGGHSGGGIVGEIQRSQVLTIAERAAGAGVIAVALSPAEVIRHLEAKLNAFRREKHK